MFSKRRPALTNDPARGAWRSAQGLLWISETPVESGWWSTVHAQRGETGLWPLLLQGLGTSTPMRPWESGELLPELIRTRPGDHDVSALLRMWFEGQMPLEEELAEVGEVIAPFRDGWPGLAPPGAIGTDPEEHAVESAELLADFDRAAGARLGLVPCSRGADAPAAIGWSGPLNHENDTAMISAVLRSWEERFGARLVALGFDTMVLSVAAPPREIEHARLVAAEHLGFCPDNITQGTGSLEEYAKELLGAEQWGFWWD
ncbi:DUF4253 domain-containing protein [Actinoplanes sp. NPDC020271]|uniref:DUF4253 domain-containing protein n=1 Tax=Actinoplanes sp. NPDC020271 TaxID=3363896 RepID=UPI0037BD761B